MYKFLESKNTAQINSTPNYRPLSYNSSFGQLVPALMKVKSIFVERFYSQIISVIFIFF